MTKKIVIAGCRHYTDYVEAEAYIDFCISEIRHKHTLIFVSGGCRGADALGERYAKKNGYPIERYPADWKVFGKAAGPIRNKKMAEIADYIICFWDEKSKGTKSMIDCARKAKKPIRIKRITNNNPPA
ncbi:MAG: DUF2493 domain-containing protein [Clostridia bacterium]|nr:DUF2493 domain-containing protein [Clostridia bacterium]